MAGDIMKNITLGLVFCLFFIPFFSGAVVSADIIGDTMGMSSLDYHFYEDIRSADLIVQGILFDQKSIINNSSPLPIQTEGKIYIKKILKQSNTSNITEGMTIEEYVFGGTVDNKTTCAGNICPIPVPDETFEGIYFLGNWDPWGKGRYYKFKSSSRSIDEIIPAIANAEKGLPIKLLDMSIAAQDERERQKKGIVSTTAVPEITNITPSIGSGGTNTKLTINGTGFGEKQSPYSNADVIFFSGHDDNYLEYYASGRQEPNYNPNEIINWTDTRIEVNVPSGLLLIEKEYVPFPTSSGYIYVRTDEEESSEKYPFSVPFSFGRRKWNSNTISYVVNADNNSDFLNAINAAADSWNAIAPTNFFLTFPETLH